MKEYSGMVSHLPTGPWKLGQDWWRYQDVNPVSTSLLASVLAVNEGIEWNGLTSTHWALETWSGLVAVPRREPSIYQSFGQCASC